MNNDYNDFLQGNKESPTKLDCEITEMVFKDMIPDHKILFLKLTLIQGFIGFLTLTFCPQFNFSLTNNYELFHYFHHTFGHSVCMIICGAIFLGSGALFAKMILSSSEIESIRKSKFLYYMGLSILALATFMILGAKIYLHLVLYWLVGAIFGGILILELSHFLFTTVTRKL